MEYSTFSVHGQSNDDANIDSISTFSEMFAIKMHLDYQVHQLPNALMVHIKNRNSSPIEDKQKMGNVFLAVIVGYDFVGPFCVPDMD